MSPALHPVSPDTLKRILEEDGFHVAMETDYNWTLFKKEAPMPVIVIPRKGELVAVDVMMSILDHLKINNARYFELLKKSSN